MTNNLLAFTPKHTAPHAYSYACPCAPCHSRHSRELAAWQTMLRECRRNGGQVNRSAKGTR